MTFIDTDDRLVFWSLHGDVLKIFTQTILILICIAVGLYLARMMQEVVGYMSAMSDHTARFSQTLNNMSTDIKSMEHQIKSMHGGISDIDNHFSMMSADIKSMSVQIQGMHNETTKIENHFSKINADMSSIQSTMSADLNSMSQGVSSMSYDVRYMRDSLLKMSTDIRQGSEVFSAPQDYFRNMFDYSR